MRNLASAFIVLLLVCEMSHAKAKSNSNAEKKTVTVTSGSPQGKREEGDFVIEKRNDGSTVKYKKKTSYDFEGSSIEGIYNKPSGAYISNIKDVRGKSVIKIRENFDSEVADSSRLVK